MEEKLPITNVGDIHKSTPNDSEEPRITLAYDILPRKALDPTFNKNHWIPF